MSPPGVRLRALLDAERPLLLPGVSDALTARLAADVGFPAVYATGAGIANAHLGLPDLGLATASEVLAQVARICDAVEVPVLADIDTGYGNALNVRRTIREAERAGVAGVQLEDQVTPKRCGHFDDVQVVPTGEMLGRIGAALDARRDPSLVLIARSDALASEGLDRTVERARTYAEAGADVVFVEAPPSLEVLAELPRRIDAPLLANMVEGGRTPVLTASELGALGYRIVLYANTALRVAAAAARAALAALRRDGGSATLEGRMLSWDERQRLVGLPEQQALAERYADIERGPIPGSTRQEVT